MKVPAPRQFAVATLGCKVNQHDSAAIHATLETLGWSPTTGRCGLVVINTCCVTAAAMAKSRQAIRRCARRYPKAAVLVVGCYSDFDPGRVRQVLWEAGVAPDRILLAGHHNDLRAVLEQVAQQTQDPCRTHLRCSPCALPNDQPAPAGTRPAAARADSLRARRLAAIAVAAAGTSGLEMPSRLPGHQRAFVKVQDGCDAFCSYCVVPYARCIARWRPIEDVLAQCARLVEAGHREIVLCGVFLGAYGRSTAIRRCWSDGPAPLVELVRRVGEVPGLWRVRLSSLEPGDVSDKLLDACRRLGTFAPHLHLPLQSGSAAILRRMNRQYTPDQFVEAVGRVRSALDRPAVSTDVIVGFPGESQDDFTATLELARKAAFMKIHAFPFSAIPGTAAWAWRHQAPPPGEVRRRMGQLARLEAELAGHYARQWIGHELEAVVEKVGRAGVCTGTSDRYLDVRFAAVGLSAGAVARVAVTSTDGPCLLGRFVRTIPRTVEVAARRT